MAFPALTRLELSDLPGEYETHNMEVLCSIFEQSHTNLTHLAIHKTPFTSDELLYPGVSGLKALIAPLPQDNQEFEKMNQVDYDDDDDYNQLTYQKMMMKMMLDQSDKATTDIEVSEGQCLLLGDSTSQGIVAQGCALEMENLPETLHMAYPTLARKKALERLKTLHKSLRWFRKNRAWTWR
ncbi:hypothetical protein BT96DRAFT_984299 [Gymnopus androsaceus JB14]|uniref:Uncharacterized protein n=1 Tax=Gymnopus androsaceus JB14 TaxID=1447944 RepID=A0A6A4IK66_9AGAR|nr:hypothetical protein BT96DRAFT_984299 [Gymnopus androsaceus JB14]